MFWIKRKLSLGQWNIGLIESLNEKTIVSQITRINWLKHNYWNCCFADPFIYCVRKDTVELFAEQIFFWRRNARLVKLTVDRRSGVLMQCTPILQLETHLSYPFIIQWNDRTYVIPENVASGRLDLYEYDEQTEKLRYLHPIIDAPLADATIVERNNLYYLFATKKGADNSDLHIWVSDNIFTNYSPLFDKPFKSDLQGSRMAGAFWRQGDRLFRPAQDCSKGYGVGILLYEVIDLSPNGYQEQLVNSFYPVDRYYDAGMHTLNIHQDIGIVDGYRLKINPLMKIAKKIKR